VQVWLSWLSSLDQLLGGMDSGGVSSVVIVESPPIHPHPPCKQTLAAAEWWCSSQLLSSTISIPPAIHPSSSCSGAWIQVVCHPRSSSKAPPSTPTHPASRHLQQWSGDAPHSRCRPLLAFLPQSTPQAVAQGHGFRWCHPWSSLKAPIHPHPPCKQTLAAVGWWCFPQLSLICVHVHVHERHRFVLLYSTPVSDCHRLRC
jgi:hypothetical protein